MVLPPLATLVFLVAAVLLGLWYASGTGPANDEAAALSIGDSRADSLVCPHCVTANGQMQVHCRNC